MPSNAVFAGSGLGAAVGVGGAEVVGTAVGLGVVTLRDGAATGSWGGSGHSSRRPATTAPTATTTITAPRTNGMRGRAACRARRRWDIRRIIPRSGSGLDRPLGGGVRTQHFQHRRVDLHLVERRRDVLGLRGAVEVDVEDVLERRAAPGTRLELGEVHAPVGERLERAEQRAGTV